MRACGCGAVVAHHLAKVRVASSNLVIRSSGSVSSAELLVDPVSRTRWRGREARQRPAKPCTPVQIRSSPRCSLANPSDFADELLQDPWAVGAAVARFPDTEEVAGSIPVPPTDEMAQAGFARSRGLGHFWLTSHLLSLPISRQTLSTAPSSVSMDVTAPESRPPHC